MFLLLLFVTILLTICIISGFIFTVIILLKSSKQLDYTERLQFHQLLGTVVLGLIACIAGLFVAFQISINISVVFIIDLLLLLVQFRTCHFKLK